MIESCIFYMFQYFIGKGFFGGRYLMVIFCEWVSFSEMIGLFFVFYLGNLLIY